MVTKPVPIWERWMRSPEGRKNLYLISTVGIILLNLFIILGVILFIIFWANQ